MARRRDGVGREENAGKMEEVASTSARRKQKVHKKREKRTVEASTFELKMKTADESAKCGRNAPAKRKKGNRGKESGTSSDEERWLHAIESGKLEEVDDELEKIKPRDPKTMTARQRAIYERGTDKEPSAGGETLLALPSGYREKVMTAEALQKAAIKSQKRKQLADEKRERDKLKTMERLLKKQESKTSKGNSKLKPVERLVPMISYRNTVEGVTLSIPPDVAFPLKLKKRTEPPKPVVCAITDCTNLKKYSCSQTGIPLCSLECYKKNLSNVVS